jgi:predicted nucleic acid-binding protein
MTPVFGDAYYFIALLNDGDEDHDRAIGVAGSLRAPIVTTEYILIEVADALAGLYHRKSFAAFVKKARSLPQMEVIFAGGGLFEAGLALYDVRPDKDWSLTDCISFEVMRIRRLTDALTADHHFAQAGFRLLL